MRADITDDEREDVKKELFKEAFAVIKGTGNEKKVYWCFCTNQWKQSRLWQFCTKCDECRDVRERHCERCGKRNIGVVCECNVVLNEIIVV